MLCGRKSHASVACTSVDATCLCTTVVLIENIKQTNANLDRTKQNTKSVLKQRGMHADKPHYQQQNTTYRTNITDRRTTRIASSRAFPHARTHKRTQKHASYDPCPSSPSCCMFLKYSPATVRSLHINTSTRCPYKTSNFVYLFYET